MLTSTLTQSIEKRIEESPQPIDAQHVLEDSLRKKDIHRKYLRKAAGSLISAGECTVGPYMSSVNQDYSC